MGDATTIHCCECGTELDERDCEPGHDEYVCDHCHRRNHPALTNDERNA